jgi:hypothetical protein
MTTQAVTLQDLTWRFCGAFHLCGVNSRLVAKPEKFVPVPTWTVTALVRSRWRGGRFACYAQHVLPYGYGLELRLFLPRDFTKHHTINRLQTNDKD